MFKYVGQCFLIFRGTVPLRVLVLSPSMPILPSPSLSAAARNALVSLSVRSLPSAAKPFSTNLAKRRDKTQSGNPGHSLNTTITGFKYRSSVQVKMIKDDDYNNKVNYKVVIIVLIL